MKPLRSLFLLDPDVIFLNHGSFGAISIPVFEVYQAWQRRLERQPVQFLGREIHRHLADARHALGAFINADPDDLVYIPNATFGLNIVARSLDLGPGDEVLTTDHEYGACNNVWGFLRQKRRFSYVQQHIPLPIESPVSMIEQFWSAVSPATKVIFISHITSLTAQNFPVAEICARARQAGILTVIDGAHALGQIPLDMAEIDADFYFSNGHKWLCSPKGSAFLYARRQKQDLLEPLVVGWGWGPNRSYSYGSDFLDHQQWLGTNDLSAYLSVPTAIAFQEEHAWPTVRAKCRMLLTQALERVAQLTGIPALYGSPGKYSQMAIAPLPPLSDPAGMKAALYDEFKVEIPITEWNDRHFLRISIQAYNSAADVDTLIVALRALLPLFQA